MRAFHEDAWAGVFAEVVQNILKELLAGKTDALSVVVENEKARVLSNVPALVIPAARVVVGDFNMELESESESAVAECLRGGG